MHKGRKPNRTALPKLHRQENTCLRSFFDADEICAEYYWNLIQQVLPHSFRRSSGQDFAVLYKV